MQKIKKITFSLPVYQIDRVKKLVSEGYRSSQNTLVSEALDLYLKEIERKKVREVMLRAAKDPLFLADIDECVENFRHGDKECIPEC